MKKKVLGLVTVVAALSIGLAACSPKDDAGDKGGETAQDKNEELEFPIAVENDEDPIEGGDLEVAVVTDSQFQGLFLWELYQDAYDSRFMQPSHEALFSNDNDFKITDEGIATMELDQEAKKATVTLQEDAKWSDGEPVTADDIIYPYEIIGHKDYEGIRYGDDFTNIVGMEEYHDGKEDSIKGIVKKDDKTVEIEFKEVDPGMLQAGGGVWGYAAPKHVLKDIPVGELASSDAVRKNPVTFGPYTMNKIVAGESVEYVPNEHYYKGKPKLDKITLTSVSDSAIVEALKANKYDIALSMPTDNYDTYEDLESYQMLGRPEQAYTYIGFKMGKWDGEKGTVVYDENAKMSDKSLRQAMGYAVDNDAVGEKFYHGLRSGATTLIPPVFAGFHDDSIEGYTHNEEKAKEILKEAGYEDKDGDGFVEDKDGKELVIKFASMAGGETAEPLAEYYMQQWEKIGLNVELATGRLIDFQAFYDKLENDDPEIDVYQGAWGTGSDPSPTGLYGRNAAFNYPRYASEKNDELLKAIDSEASFDGEARKKAFSDWQEFAVEEAFVIPTLYRNEVLPVHNRVKNLDWDPATTDLWSILEVTSETRE